MSVEAHSGLLSAPPPAIVVGISGSPASLAAVRYAGAAAGATRRLVLVCVLDRRLTSKQSAAQIRWVDTLGEDAYLVAAAAVVTEIRRTAREAAYRSGARDVDEFACAGGRFDTLAHAVTTVRADTLILGTSRTRPTSLIRRLQRLDSVRTVTVRADGRVVTDERSATIGEGERRLRVGFRSARTLRRSPSWAAWG